MQAAVGGTIQALYPFEEPVALICNDEGKLLNLPPNRVLYHPETGGVYDVVYAPCFLCVITPDSDSFTDLTPGQLTRFQHYFHSLELFLQTDSGLLILRED